MTRVLEKKMSMVNSTNRRWLCPTFKEWTSQLWSIDWRCPVLSLDGRLVDIAQETLRVEHGAFWPLRLREPVPNCGVLSVSTPLPGKSSPAETGIARCEWRRGQTYQHSAGIRDHGESTVFTRRENSAAPWLRYTNQLAVTSLAHHIQHISVWKVVTEPTP